MLVIPTLIIDVYDLIVDNLRPPLKHLRFGAVELLFKRKLEV